MPATEHELTLACPVSLGFRMGWADARRYVAGTKADRREIRRMLAKSEQSYCEFWESYKNVFTQAIEDHARAIRDGRIARTIRPTKLYALVNRSQIN